MSHGNFLVRNRHAHHWYGRVIIPTHLRHHFAGKRELRLSLNTANKSLAKRHSRHFWLHCQQGFDLLATTQRNKSFKNTRAFLDWLAQKGQGQADMAYKIDFTDVMGRRHVIDLDDAEQEKELALKLQENALKLFDYYKDNPDVLTRLMGLGSNPFAAADNQPESPTSFHEAIDLYIDKLETQGRNGRKLAPRTLIDYRDKLSFWQKHFGQRPMHTFTLKELGEIQSWLIYLPANFAKKNISVAHAVTMAQHKSNRHPPISDKTRCDYLGQLKGLLEFAHSNGFIAKAISHHVEIPNTKHTIAVERLPFTDDDLQKIFPGSDYGVEFGIHKAGIDQACKFWIPLLAAFTGARLEELCQLKTEDIRTCPDTGIIYAMVDNKGIAGDGEKKRTKNLNSVRPIPIHSTLLDIGFMAYVDERKQDKANNSLFKLKRDNQGRLGKSVSNWFSRMDKRKDGKFTLGYIERRGVISKGENQAGEKWSKSFHSFRHTVIDNLRGKQFPNGDFIREPDIALVVGHDREKLETASYGKDRMQLTLRKAVIESINYEKVFFMKTLRKNI